MLAESRRVFTLFSLRSRSSTSPSAALGSEQERIHDVRQARRAEKSHSRYACDPDADCNPTSSSPARARSKSSLFLFPPSA